MKARVAEPKGVGQVVQERRAPRQHPKQRWSTGTPDSLHDVCFVTELLCTKKTCYLLGATSSSIVLRLLGRPDCLRGNRRLDSVLLRQSPASATQRLSVIGKTKRFKHHLAAIDRIHDAL